jgi:predicted DNA-binding transcriptional regulator AlpA
MMSKMSAHRAYFESEKVYDRVERESAQPLFDKLIWGIDEVCSFTSYAKGTVYNKVSSGEIPYRRGRKRKLVFIPSEIIKWFKGE